MLRSARSHFFLRTQRSSCCAVAQPACNSRIAPHMNVIFLQMALSLASPASDKEAFKTTIMHCIPIAAACRRSRSMRMFLHLCRLQQNKQQTKSGKWRGKNSAAATLVGRLWALALGLEASCLSLCNCNTCPAFRITTKTLLPYQIRTSSFHTRSSVSQILRQLHAKLGANEFCNCIARERCDQTHANQKRAGKEQMSRTRAR